MSKLNENITRTCFSLEGEFHFNVRTELGHLRGDFAGLNRELIRRRQAQYLWVWFARVNSAQHREDEGRRFSRSGL